MILAAISAFKYIQANWKIVAIVAALASAFVAGWMVRGHIATAEKNAEIVAAVEATKLEERANYDKARKIEEFRRKSREKARVAASSLAEGLVDSECLDAPVIPIEWLRISWEAIADFPSNN